MRDARGARFDAWVGYAAAALVVAIPFVLIAATLRLDSPDPQPRDDRPADVVVDVDERGERRDRDPERSSDRNQGERQNTRSRSERSSEGEADPVIIIGTPFFHVAAGISGLGRRLPAHSLSGAAN